MFLLITCTVDTKLFVNHCPIVQKRSSINNKLFVFILSIMQLDFVFLYTLDNDIVQISNISGKGLSPWKFPLWISASDNVWPRSLFFIFHEDIDSAVNLTVSRDIYHVQAPYNQRIWDDAIFFLIFYLCYGKVLVILFAIIQDGFISNKLVFCTSTITSTTFPLIWKNFMIIQIVLNAVWDNTQQFPYNWEAWGWSKVSYFISFMWIFLTVLLSYSFSSKLGVLPCCWLFRPFLCYTPM